MGRASYSQHPLKDGIFVDNATKKQLKQPDQFVSLTEQGIDWANQNRSQAITWVVLAVSLILVLIGGYGLYSSRSAKAETALGAALRTYQTPIAGPDQQVPPGAKTFESVDARDKAALPAMQDVASKYGMMKSGTVAKYFVGVMYAEMGQNQSAEDALKPVASSWDKDLSALAKLALAQLYRNTGREPQAVALYNEIANGSASTVSPGMAKIQLAEMYDAEGKTAEAKKIYAELKDKDKGKDGKPGIIGAIAGQKLNPQGAGLGPQ